MLAIGKRLTNSRGLFKSTFRTSNAQKRPPSTGDGGENYYTAATSHLERLLSSLNSRRDYLACLSELQVVLLISTLALMMPVASGLWYTVGVAVRLSVDLGLHRDGECFSERQSESTPAVDLCPAEWSPIRTKDLKRRLWWCVYSLDRILCTCTERPFGIADEVISTRFPSLCEESAITTMGITADASGRRAGSKLIAQHFFRYRRLQSEILQVVQNREARDMWGLGDPHGSPSDAMPPLLSFLHSATSYKEWRTNKAQSLLKWCESAPTQQETGVAFDVLFCLNYWQALMMLYRQRVDLPGTFQKRFATTQAIICRGPMHDDQKSGYEDEHLILAEAGQHVIRLYRQLQQRGLLCYPYLATYHIFLAGKQKILVLIAYVHLTKSQQPLCCTHFGIPRASSRR